MNKSFPTLHPSAEKLKHERGSLYRLGQQTAPSTVVLSWVLIISLLGDLRLLSDLGTGSGGFDFLGVEWVTLETKLFLRLS